MRSRSEVEVDVALFRNLFSALSDQLDLGKESWDIEMIRFCLENMGQLTNRSPASMLDVLQRLCWKDLVDDDEILDRCLALIPDEPTYRILDEVLSTTDVAVPLQKPEM